MTTTAEPAAAEPAAGPGDVRSADPDSAESDSAESGAVDTGAVESGAADTGSDTGAAEPGAGCARRPGRPRERRVDRAIVAATLEIFADDGYHALSMEAVAARAGVGKATIYRRWPGKKELVIDALATLNDDLLPARESLPARADDRIRAILRHLTDRDSDTLIGRITPRMLVYSVSQPDLYADYFDRVIIPRRRWLHEILRESVRRGDLRSDLDVEAAALALVGPTLMPAHSLGLDTNTDPDGHHDLADRLFDVLWSGLAAAPTDSRVDERQAIRR